VIQDRDLGDETDHVAIGTTPQTLPLLEQIHAAYANAPDDVAILGDALQPCDRGEDYLQDKRSYAWYWAIGRVLKPRVLAEIGVRFGYSALAIAKGADGLRSFHGFDNELYVPGSITRAYDALCLYAPVDCAIHNLDTQTVEGDLGHWLPRTGVNLFHIDGDHTFNGADKDLWLAQRGTKQGGFILVDDIDWHPEVKEAADQFCEREGYTPVYLPTFRGLYVIPV
jgi:hypothetical protein